MKLLQHPPAVLLTIWRRIPGRLQAPLLFMLAPKVTMGVSAVIEDRKGRVLLAHHTYRQVPWALPSGLIGRHEEPPVALARELREELGVEALVGSLLHAEKEPGARHLTLYYQATLLGVARPDGTEVDRVQYSSPDEVQRLLGGVAPEWLRLIQRNARPAA